MDICIICTKGTSSIHTGFDTHSDVPILTHNLLRKTIYNGYTEEDTMLVLIVIVDVKVEQQETDDSQEEKNTTT